jgi:tRNA pseudouridine55 synthase
MSGLLVIDKAGGMTSRDAVNRIQRWFPRRTKVGHTGTLDPLATGVLVVCVGAATRLAEFVQGMGKTYRTRLLLGHRSDTDDADGMITMVAGASVPSDAAVREVAASFVGAIEQVPPAFSALKVGGRRAHELARQGAEVPLAPRTVNVYAVRVLDYAYPTLDLEVDCGKGTYIRSIARDLGDKLGCGGIVQTLRRTRVGPFTVELGVGVDIDPGAGRSKVLPTAAAVAGLPAVTAPTEVAARIRHGQRVRLDTPAGPHNGPAAVFDERRELVAVGALDPSGWFAPSVVLNG